MPGSVTRAGHDAEAAWPYACRMATRKKTARRKTAASPKPRGATSARDWLARLPEDRRADVEALDALIRRCAPALKPVFSPKLGMMGYGPYHYRYASGREGESFHIALASQVQHLSLYLSCTDGAGAYVAEKHRAALKPASVGRSCIRFRRLEQMDLGVLEKVVREAAAAKPLGG